ncbi:unnamed protein product [Sphagnum balticum]
MGSSRRRRRRRRRGNSREWRREQASSPASEEKRFVSEVRFPARAFRERWTVGGGKSGLASRQPLGTRLCVRSLVGHEQDGLRSLTGP